MPQHRGANDAYNEKAAPDQADATLSDQGDIWVQKDVIV